MPMSTEENLIQRPGAGRPAPVLNPRYEGATPEDVGRALLRPLEPPRKREAEDGDAEAA